MNYPNAVHAIRCIRDEGRNHTVRFVAPSTSCILAAATVRHKDSLARIDFAPDAQQYASSNGLIDALSGQYVTPVRSGRQGFSYTKLTRLATHVEVDHCNAIINDLIASQFAGFSPAIVGLLRKVVGELHDNVASHASASGFSAAQVYDDGASRRIEFAVADAGCGMLSNVNRVNPAINDDPSAIEWCLKRGNTTARSADEWEQRLPEDALYNPFPKTVAVARTEDHHAGEGLWKLQQLIEKTNGSPSPKGLLCRMRVNENFKNSEGGWEYDLHYFPPC